MGIQHDRLLLGKVEGVDDQRIDVFHLAVDIPELRIIWGEGNVVKQVILVHEQLAVGVLSR